MLIGLLSETITFFDALLGLGAPAHALGIGQIAARAVLIYLAGFAMLRFGEHRFLGKNTAFDIILGFIFGAMLSRAINGAAPFLPTLLAGIILLAMHWLLATAAFYSEHLRKLIAGSPLPLIQDGNVQENCLRKSRISEPMLRENLRINGHLDDPAQVRAAYYEPSGNVSVVPRSGGSAHSDGPPRVVEVQVEEGVQTVRIALDG